MHPNPTFRQTPDAEALAVARQRSFGILSINGDTAPLTAHIPFAIADDGHSLTAHLVASNPIWRAVSDGPKPALVSISGPDAYISPDWYGLEDQVPTWNYVAVNLRGTLSALPQEDLRVVLETLSDQFETRLAPKPVWKTDKVSPDALARMQRQIRPVTMTIEGIESTLKLGQNKPEAARQGAVDGLGTSAIGQEVAALTALMRQTLNDVEG